MLQQRITANRGISRVARETPATFVVFDILQDADGSDLRSRPLSLRRERLETTLAPVPPAVTLCPQTTSYDLAKEWLSDWTAAGVEGVLAKGPNSRYTPGKRGGKSINLSGSAVERTKQCWASALVGGVGVYITCATGVCPLNDMLVLTVCVGRLGRRNWSHLRTGVGRSSTACKIDSGRSGRQTAACTTPPRSRAPLGNTGPTPHLIHCGTAGGWTRTPPSGRHHLLVDICKSGAADSGLRVPT
jgi:hypothetical protein